MAQCSQSANFMLTPNSCQYKALGQIFHFPSFWQGRNKSGQVGFFPETYIEVGSAASHSPPQITPSNSNTDGQPGGSPVSVARIGQTTSAATKYCKFMFSLCYLIFCCEVNRHLVLSVSIILQKFIALHTVTS